jgi:uncharacterized protein YebE (UPF0316 family)
LLWPLVAGYLFIFFARVTDMSLTTIRTLMIVRGRRLQAALIGFFEVIIYITALNRVVNQLDNPLNLLSYALGFATGNYVGIFIEEKMAIGNITVQIISKTESVVIEGALRNAGYGVTVFKGTGLEGERNVINVHLFRKDLPWLLERVRELDREAFITVMDARSTLGGYYKRTHKAK